MPWQNWSRLGTSFDPGSQSHEDGSGRRHNYREDFWGDGTAKLVGNSPCPAGTSEDEKGPLDCNIPVYDIEGTTREGRSIVVAITPLGNLV